MERDAERERRDGGGGGLHWGVMEGMTNKTDGDDEKDEMCVCGVVATGWLGCEGAREHACIPSTYYC